MMAQLNRKNLAILLLLFPVSIFLASYCFLALIHREVNLFPVVVHENGKYTLLQTIFYFDHLLREIPIAILMSLALAIAFYWRSPLRRSNNDLALRRILRNSISMTIFLIVIVVAGAINKNGFRSALLDFFQYRTRDDLVAYGSHWQFHLLHLAYFLPACLVMIEIFRSFTLPYAEKNPGSKQLMLCWIILFLFLTLLFAPSLRPFTDPRYLAHQMRELATHSLTTFPLASALFFFYENRLDGIRPNDASAHGVSRLAIFAMLPAVIIPLFILYQLHGVNISSIAQKQTGITELLAFHFFEHSIDSMIAAALSLFFYFLFLLKLKP